MPAPTAEALRAALATMSPEAAFASFGVTRQGVYYKRRGVHIHPDLVAVLAEHRAATTDRTPRNASGKQGLRKVRLPATTVAYLDARAYLGKHATERSHVTRSAVARAMIQKALLGPLPAPEEASGEYVVLDLGPAWTDLAAALGTDDPHEVGGTARAILGGTVVPETPPPGREQRIQAAKVSVRARNRERNRATQKKIEQAT